MDKLKGNLSTNNQISGKLSSQNELSASLNIPQKIYPSSYHGSYTITPSAETQILETEGLMMTQDLTINPIPSNYGLITWDGSTLTVS